ncbi:unnamed protein product [Didymodactylos carnosus]|uniref:Uncharacterized protein n=1 Tax=Didymodactylos carnosus TaxID=1234261 RepID=A0A8S2RGV3_9BILA|nr:unnamed protein product [Didymodactylos carnosus]CAF4159916.1 unnamed protein product [Didymodactylos carnosus]
MTTGVVVALFLVNGEHHNAQASNTTGHRGHGGVVADDQKRAALPTHLNEAHHAHNAHDSSDSNHTYHDQQQLHTAATGNHTAESEGVPQHHKGRNLRRTVVSPKSRFAEESCHDFLMDDDFIYVPNLNKVFHVTRHTLFKITFQAANYQDNNEFVRLW